MVKKLCILIVLFLFGVVGCSKSVQIQMEVNPEDRTLPVVHMVKKVELAFRQQDGQELKLSSAKVEGLSVGEHLHFDRIPEVSTGQKGTWVGRALRGDGKVLLAGQSQNKGDLVQILLTRPQPSGNFFNRLRIDNVESLRDFRLSWENGGYDGKKCIELPLIPVKKDLSPKLVLEEVAPGYSMSFLAQSVNSAGVLLETPDETALSRTQKPLGANNEDQVVMELSDEHLGFDFQTNTQQLMLFLFKKQESAPSLCLKLKTEPEFIPLQLDFHHESGLNYDADDGAPIAEFRIANLNKYPVTVDIKGKPNMKHGLIYYRFNTNDRMPRHDRSHSQSEIGQVKTIGPESALSIHLLGIEVPIPGQFSGRVLWKKGIHIDFDVDIKTPWGLHGHAARGTDT